MRKNAFTLIELIAAIGLLGMLSTIVITISIKKINESKLNSRQTLINSIELAAKQYAINNEEDLSDYKNKDYVYISLQTLVEKEYFTSSLVDPTTESNLPLTDEVYVTRNELGNVSSVYDIDQKNKATIILNGSYNEYVKKDSNYKEQGVTAIKNGLDISENIIITGNVDTTTLGTYVIKYSYENKTITRNVIVYEKKIESSSSYKYMSSYITSLYRNVITRDENGLIRDNTKDENIRYSGSNPNNYVYFNCKDKDENEIDYGNDNYDYEGSCEIWRIIGIFDIKQSKNGISEKRIKIVSEVKEETKVWNEDNVAQWGETILPDGTEYSGASLMRYLNIGEESYYNSLSNVAKNQMTESLWNMGSVIYPEESELSSESVYKQERGTTTSIDDGNYINYTTEWIGNIALIYLSDYGYAGSKCENIFSVECGNFNWLKNTWMITRENAPNSNIWSYFYGYLSTFPSVFSENYRPTLFLKSTIQRIGGNGTIDNPYKLSKII